MVTLSPSYVLAALLSAENEWPSIFGPKWSDIQPQYRALLTQLENTTGAPQMRAAAELVELFAPYAAARERLNNALKAQTEGGRLMLSLADLSKQIGLEPAVIIRLRSAALPSSSQRLIWQSGPTKATSIKLANVWVHFECGAFCEFLSGLITTTLKDVMGETNGLLQAAGTLLMIASFYKATAIKLDEREATVFYGFAKAGAEVKEDLILAHTNQVRQAVSLKPLDLQELDNALYKLAEIKSIEQVKGSPGLWRIIENHKVKPIP